MHRREAMALTAATVVAGANSGVDAAQTRGSVDALRVRPMGRDQAIATWNLDYHFQRGTLPAMRERLRASALLRRTSGGWKFSYYSESPKSAMTYLRELYEATVTPEFRRKVEAAAATSETVPPAPR